jgi:hypothetical protein
VELIQLVVSPVLIIVILADDSLPQGLLDLPDTLLSILLVHLLALELPQLLDRVVLVIFEVLLKVDRSRDGVGEVVYLVLIVLFHSDGHESFSDLGALFDA